MKVIDSTDGRHLGKELIGVNRGDSVDLDGFVFYVQTKITTDSGQILLSNPNYQLICEE